MNCGSNELQLGPPRRSRWGRRGLSRRGWLVRLVPPPSDEDAALGLASSSRPAASSSPAVGRLPRRALSRQVHRRRLPRLLGRRPVPRPAHHHRDVQPRAGPTRTDLARRSVRPRNLPLHAPRRPRPRPQPRRPPGLRQAPLCPVRPRRGRTPPRPPQEERRDRAVRRAGSRSRVARQPDRRQHLDEGQQRGLRRRPRRLDPVARRPGEVGRRRRGLRRRRPRQDLSVPVRLEPGRRARSFGTRRRRARPAPHAALWHHQLQLLHGPKRRPVPPVRPGPRSPRPRPLSLGRISRSRSRPLLLARRRSFGEPFVQETFLYHLSRLDHRHNFSAYFYPFYLSASPSAPPPSSAWQLAARHPLAAFLPQLVLSLGLGALFGAQDLPFAWLVQTVAFVTFNKVCTSQVRSLSPLSRLSYMC